MKKRLWLPLLAAIAASTLISCSKSDNAPASTNTTNNSDTTLKTQIISGTWTITSYTQRTEDKTSQFASVIFTFSNDGTLVADKNGNKTSGTWSFSPSTVGYYGGPPSKASMTINLGATSPFDRLTKIWNVASNTSTQIKMDNPEPLEDEHVQFSKQ